MKSFHLDQIMPPELVVDFVDNHLYRIGLCLRNNNNNKKRSFMNKPIVVFTLLLFHLIKCLIHLYIKSDSDLFIYFAIIEEIKIFVNICIIFLMNFLISLIVIWFHNYMNDIKPTFLKVFQMMSGFITPVSIGLTNHKQIIKLMKRTRILFKILRYNTDILVPIITTIFCLTTYIIKCNSLDIFIFGILNTISFTL